MGNSPCDWILSLVRPLSRGQEPYDHLDYHLDIPQRDQKVEHASEGIRNAKLVNLALEPQKCEVRDLDSTMEPSANLSPLYDALDTVDRQPEHVTRRDARSGSDNVSSSSSS